MMEHNSSHLSETLAGHRSTPLTRTPLIIFVLGMLAVAPMSASAAVKAVPVLTSDLASINASITGTMVEVKATIKTITPPREGSRQPFKVNLTDDKSAITLIIWRDLWEALNKQYSLATGDVVEVRALVTEYRNQVQLNLKDITDFQIPGKTPAAVSNAEPSVGRGSNVPPAASTSTTKPGTNDDVNAPPTPAAQPPAEPTPLSAVNLAMKGQKILIQALVTEVHEPTSERAPYKVTLSDGTKSVTLVYWKDLQAAVSDRFRAGNTIRATVTVSEYRNNLQLLLGDGKSVEIAGAPAAK